MGLIRTKGLVIKETAVGEADKIITLLTEDIGRVSVSCRGARKTDGGPTEPRFSHTASIYCLRAETAISLTDAIYWPLSMIWLGTWKGLHMRLT